jgi:class 3 adenylate cyclase
MPSASQPAAATTGYVARRLRDCVDIEWSEFAQLSVKDLLTVPFGSITSLVVPQLPSLRIAQSAPVAEMTHATVLFADMRGYTALAERLSPARVVCLLEEFFTILVRVTLAFGGEVFHMAGDGMMAGFGVRDSKRPTACAALAAGHAILESFAPVGARWQHEFAVVAGIGIGLHSGEVALGFLGPPGQRAITLIGDTPNVAARLCSRARAGEVLFSGTVAATLVAGDNALDMGAEPFLQLPQFELRGRNELLNIWCVPAQERLGPAIEIPIRSVSRGSHNLTSSSKRRKVRQHAPPVRCRTDEHSVSDYIPRMLHSFLTTNRALLIEQCRATAAARGNPIVMN